MDPRTPNFFVIGASKSGTTTLYEWLRQHPDVYMSDVKEPRFFCEGEKFSKGLDYYLQTYFDRADGYTCRGEASPHYFYFPDAAHRLKKSIPESGHRFIVILRNPVDRAYSMYWDMVGNGTEDLSFEDALECEPRRIKELGQNFSGIMNCQYVDSGRYAAQLREWLGVFDLDCFLILFQDELRTDPEKVAARLFRFLGIRPVEIDNARRSNPAGVSRSKILSTWLTKPSAIKRLLGHLLPFSIKYKLVRFLRNANKKEAAYPAMPIRVRERLVREFENEISDLEKITGRDLSGWRA